MNTEKSHNLHDYLHSLHHMLEHPFIHGVSLAQWVAIFTAVFSCFAAFVSYQSAGKQSEAILYKDEAIMKTALASDTWALYQSKKMKAHIMEIAIIASHDPKQITYYKTEFTRYNTDAEGISVKAQAYEQQAKTADQKSDHILKPYDRFSQAVMLLQIAISLASVAALTRRRWLLGVSIVSGISGIISAFIGWWFYS